MATRLFCQVKISLCRCPLDPMLKEQHPFLVATTYVEGTTYFLVATSLMHKQTSVTDHSNLGLAEMDKTFLSIPQSCKIC